VNRSKHIVTVLAVSYCMGAVALAQDAGANREADHQALRQLRANVMKAVSSQDLTALGTFFAKEFVLTAVDQTVVTTREGMAAYYARMFKDKDAPIVKMDVTGEADILTRFTDANTGYCYGSALATYTLKDKSVVKLRERWTGVVAREDGAWKIAAVHIGVNFLDNPVIRYRSMSVWKKMGIWLHLSKPPSD